MKKFLVCFVLLFIGISCKKDLQLCGCSVVEYTFHLSVQGANDQDLLAPNAAGGYTADQIKLYYKEGNDLKPLDFIIRPPFSYGQNVDIKYDFYQLHSSEIMRYRLAGKTGFYIKLGDDAPLPLSFDLDQNNNTAGNVKINNIPLVEAEIGEGYPPLWVLVK